MSRLAASALLRAGLVPLQLSTFFLGSVARLFGLSIILAVIIWLILQLCTFRLKLDLLNFNDYLLVIWLLLRCVRCSFNWRCRIRLRIYPAFAVARLPRIFIWLAAVSWHELLAATTLPVLLLDYLLDGLGEFLKRSSIRALVHVCFDVQEEIVIRVVRLGLSALQLLLRWQSRIALQLRSVFVLLLLCLLQLRQTLMNL